VHGEGSTGVGAGIDGAIIVVILGGHDLLGSGELLFQVTGDDLLLLPSEVATRSCAQDSFMVLCAAATAATRASCSRCTVAAAVACCSSMERLEVLLGMVGKTIEARGGGGGWQRQTIGLGQR
jgi:hypothetical protein